MVQRCSLNKFFAKIRQQVCMFKPNIPRFYLKNSTAIYMQNILLLLYGNVKTYVNTPEVYIKQDKSCATSLDILFVLNNC